MSGYQSLHDLIADRTGQDLDTNQIEGLANVIITEWLPTELKAVNDAAEQARKQLAKARADLEQHLMTVNMPNVGGAQ